MKSMKLINEGRKERWGEVGSLKKDRENRERN